MSDQIIDIKEFLERVQDDRDLLLELLDIFEQDFVEKRKNLGIAVQKKNFEEIKSIAHSLKGSSGNISAKPMHANWFKIEQLAKDSDAAGIMAIMTDIDRQFAELQQYCVQLKQDLKK